MNITNFHRIYFVGIGGIGMSALARWFKSSGFPVYGYDKTPSDITKRLISEGISITYEDSVEAVDPEVKDNTTTLVIYTPAIPKNHKGLEYFRQHNFTVFKRSEALGLLVKENYGMAVAGTHGKTSISTTLSWIMHEQCNAFLGGISKNLNSNVIINANSKNVVIEADEFDRSFLTLYPELAIVSSMDADHLDIYDNHAALKETFYKFVSQVKPQGSLVYKLSLKINPEINTQINYYTYSLENSQADFYASHITVNDGFYRFNWHTPKGEFPEIMLGIPGLYNIENAVAAMALAWLAGIDIETIKTNLKDYRGVKRRFDFQVKTDKIVYIDDYAHHPEEIKACINSVKHMYPGRPITGVFQPHLYTRTRDFADGFAASLDLCDQVILTDIYPAREEPIPGVESRLIFSKMKLKNKQLCSYNQVVNNVLKSDIDIVITMGAGDIDRLVPKIKKGLEEKYSKND